jgi:hypothetical protein
VTHGRHRSPVRIATPSDRAERRVLVLLRAAAVAVGPLAGCTWLHAYQEQLGTTPAAAAMIGGPAAYRAGLSLRALVLSERPGP